MRHSRRIGFDRYGVFGFSEWYVALIEPEQLEYTDMRKSLMWSLCLWTLSSCTLFRASRTSSTVDSVSDLLPVAPSDSAITTNSGLAYEVLVPGTGTVHPGPASTVTVHYTGWTTEGVVFDSSVARRRPATFPLNAVISGWTEGVQLMVVGEKTRFYIPEDLAYKGRPGAPAGMLMFDVELLAIE